jgi:hypothetical protein
MKATFEKPKKEGFRPSYRKENAGLYKGYKAITPEGKTLLDLRIYYPNSVAYSCLWVPCNDHASGSGKAGGYGYHKTSAAAAEAFEKAGYSLNEGVSGRGDGAILEAIQAVCALHGYENPIIVTMHP